MAVGTTAAILASTAISAGSTILSGSRASSAANQATAAINQGYDRASDAYGNAQQTITANNAPWVDVGQQALGQLAQSYGLQPPGGGGGAAGGGPDWNAYIAQNPDVQAVQDVLDGRAQGTQDQINFANDFRRSGKSNLGEYHASVVPGRAIPTTQAKQAQAPAQAQPAYQDPGRTTYAQPYNYGAAYKAPAPLDVSAGAYKQSPGYAHQLAEGSKALSNNKAVAGLLGSGSALKAITSYAQNLADDDYSAWRGYATQQYNQDRNFGRSTYENDRAYELSEYTSNRDYATGRYNTYQAGLAGLAGAGQQATGQTNQAAAGYAQALAGAAQGQGNATANNALAQGQIGNATGNALGGLASGLLQNGGLDFASLLRRGGTAYGGAAAGIYNI